MGRRGEPRPTCPLLDRPPDRRAFAGHSAESGDGARDGGGQDGDPGGVAAFADLGRDTTLVVPCPLGLADAYVHLAALVRGAPAARVRALWRATGAAMEAAIGPKPTRLSTAGMGVAWLQGAAGYAAEVLSVRGVRNAACGML